MEISDFIRNNPKGYIHCTVEEAYELYSMYPENSIKYEPEGPFTYQHLQGKLGYECITYNERVYQPSVTSYLTVIARHEESKPIFLILPTVENAVEEGGRIHTLRLPQALPEGVFVVLGRNDGKLSYIYTERTPQLEYGIQLN